MVTLQQLQLHNLCIPVDLT